MLSQQDVQTFWAFGEARAKAWCLLTHAEASEYLSLCRLFRRFDVGRVLALISRVTRYDPISIWEIDMGDRYGRSDINEISIRISKWDMGYRFGIRYIDMVIYHIDMVILDIDMGYGLMIWEMTVSIWSSSVSMFEFLSLCSSSPLPREPGSPGAGSRRP